jgi:hypothetical protein
MYLTGWTITCALDDTSLLEKISETAHGAMKTNLNHQCLQWNLAVILALFVEGQASLEE